MKKLFLFVTAVLIFAACGTATKKNNDAAEKENMSVENLVEVTYNVEGMTCEGCENAIMKSVESLEGIASVTSSFEEGWTKVSYEKGAATPEDIETKIADAGYVVKGIKE